MRAPDVPGCFSPNTFISIWIGLFLIVVLFKSNRPMLKAVKYCSPRLRSGGDSAAGIKGNRAGNNVRGLLIGLALGFGCKACAF